MFNINFKKISLFILTLIVVGVILPIIATVWSVKWKDYSVPQTPQNGDLYDTVTYLIDPSTILQSLHNGLTDVFILTTPETEPSISSILPSNSFLWKAEDYLSIANALHEQEWNESLAGWQLYSMKFSIQRCNNVEEGIDLADFIYFQRKGNLYITHVMWIYPLLKEVGTGDNQYPYRKEWTTIDINTLTVKTPDDVLKLTEVSGGRNAREKLDENGCRIILELKPDALVFSLFSNPFKLYGLGWGIKYWDSDSNIIFQDSIDAYSGK